MASNITLNPGADGSVAVTKQRTHDGDTAQQQGVFLSGVSGSEDSYTFVDVAAGGGTEATALRVTIASDSTGVVSIDDNGGSLSIDDGGNTITVDGTVGVSGTVTVAGTVDLGSTDNAVLDAIAASLALLDNAIASGNELQVDVVGALPAGDNNIGNVDIVSLPASTNTIEVVGDAAENAAVAGNPVLTGGRYDSSPRTLGNGDVGAFAVNASGQMLVEIAAGAGSGGTAAADDADFTAGTTSGTPVMGSYQSSPTAVTDGDMGIIGITANREVKVSVTSGGIAGQTEDAAASGGEEGVPLLVVRRDSASSGVSADGDWAFLSVDSSGNLRTTGSSGITSYTEDAASSGGESLVLMGAVRRDTAASSSTTDGDYSTLNTDSSGRLHVNVGNTVAVGSHPVTNAGTFAVQVDGAALTALQLIDNANISDDAAFTPASTGVVMGGFFADETATDSVDEGDGGAARMTLDRKQIMTPYAHASAGGATPYYNLDVDESEDDIKTSAGKLYWIHVMNLSASVRYIKFYNATAANVTVGTTTPVLSFPIPTMADTNGAGFAINFGSQGLQFSTAISVAATTGLADNNTGAPGANEVVLNAGYI